MIVVTNAFLYFILVLVVLQYVLNFLFMNLYVFAWVLVFFCIFINRFLKEKKKIYPVNMEYNILTLQEEIW